MAMQKGQNPLLAQAGKFRETFKRVKDEPPTVGQGDLPEISNGIARLVDCKVTTIAKGKQNEGQMMFYAAGVVVKPKSVDGVPVRGKRTQISEPLFNTPNRKVQTAQEHFEVMLNHLKKLGVDTSTFEEDTFMEEVVAAMETLTKEKPYFEFRTWRGSKVEIEQGEDGKWYVGDKKYPTKEAAQKANPFAGKEPRTNHDWGLAIPDFDEEESAEEEDATGSAEEETSSEESEETTDKEESMDEFDVDALLSSANDNDTDAQTALRDKATELGATEEWLDSDDTSWDMIADLIRNGGPKEEEAEAEEEEKPEWKKGDVTTVAKKDAKGKPVLNAKKKPVMVECELVSFDSKTKSWKCKSLDDGKTIYSVKEGDLTPP